MATLSINQQVIRKYGLWFVLLRWIANVTFINSEFNGHESLSQVKVLKTIVLRIQAKLHLTFFAFKFWIFCFLQRRHRPFVEWWGKWFVWSFLINSFGIWVGFVVSSQSRYFHRFCSRCLMVFHASDNQKIHYMQWFRYLQRKSQIQKYQVPLSGAQ